MNYEKPEAKETRKEEMVIGEGPTIALVTVGVVIGKLYLNLYTTS